MTTPTQHPTAPIRHSIPDDARPPPSPRAPLVRTGVAWRIGAMTGATSTPTGPGRWTGGTTSEDSKTPHWQGGNCNYG